MRRMNELIFSSSSITTCSLAERDTVHADNDILIVHGWRMDAMDGGSMTMILEDVVDEAEVDDSPLGSRPVFVAGLVPHHPCPRHPAFPGHALVPAGAPVQEQPQAALGLRHHLLSSTCASTRCGSPTKGFLAMLSRSRDSTPSLFFLYSWSSLQMASQ
jgi:hypothetical protein